MGWVVLACELLLLLVIWRSGEILFFSWFFYFMAANCLTAPLYITGNFYPWYLSQVIVVLLLVTACWEAFDLQAEPVRLNPSKNVPNELRLVVWASILFGLTMVLLVALRQIQFNLPPVLFRIRLLSTVMAAAFTFETWLYFVFQPPGRYHRKANGHAFLLLAFNTLTVAALLIPIDRTSGRKWELVQVAQQAMRIGILLGWINLFWVVQEKVSAPGRSRPSAA